MASFASSGVVLAPPGALRLSTSSACPAEPATVVLPEAACEDSGACAHNFSFHGCSFDDGTFHGDPFHRQGMTHKPPCLKDTHTAVSIYG